MQRRPQQRVCQGSGRVPLSKCLSTLRTSPASDYHPLTAGHPNGQTRHVKTPSQPRSYLAVLTAVVCLGCGNLPSRFRDASAPQDVAIAHETAPRDLAAPDAPLVDVALDQGAGEVAAPAMDAGEHEAGAPPV